MIELFASNGHNRDYYLRYTTKDANLTFNTKGTGIDYTVTGVSEKHAPAVATAHDEARSAFIKNEPFVMFVDFETDRPIAGGGHVTMAGSGGDFDNFNEKWKVAHDLGGPFEPLTRALARSYSVVGVGLTKHNERLYQGLKGLNGDPAKNREHMVQLVSYADAETSVRFAGSESRNYRWEKPVRAKCHWQYGQNKDSATAADHFVAGSFCDKGKDDFVSTPVDGTGRPGNRPSKALLSAYEAVWPGSDLKCFKPELNPFPPKGLAKDWKLADLGPGKMSHVFPKTMLCAKASKLIKDHLAWMLIPKEVPVAYALDTGGENAEWSNQVKTFMGSRYEKIPKDFSCAKDGVDKCKAAFGLMYSLLASWAVFAQDGDCAQELRAPSFDARNVGVAARDADSWGNGQIPHHPLGGNAKKYTSFCRRDMADVGKSLDSIPETVGLGTLQYEVTEGIDRIKFTGDVNAKIVKAIHAVRKAFDETATAMLGDDAVVTAFPLLNKNKKLYSELAQEALKDPKGDAFWTAMQKCIKAGGLQTLVPFENKFKDGTYEGDDYTQDKLFKGARTELKNLTVASLKCGLKSKLEALGDKNLELLLTMLGALRP